MKIIRLPLSIDHQKKKALTIELSFSLYLQFVTSAEFEAILAPALQEKCLKAKKAFLAENKFFSEDYWDEYKRTPYIRFLSGPEIHKFLVKVLSVNYQSHKDLLSVEAGSMAEFFSALDIFWNDKYFIDSAEGETQQWRDGLFCYACIQDHYNRVQEKKTLRARLGSFAKKELSEKDKEIARLKKQIKDMKKDLQDQQMRLEEVQDRLALEQEKNIVLVPSDPHYMLGLTPEQSSKVEERAKVLMKVLHPDKSGNAETAYLFDMILKARDMIIK